MIQSLKILGVIYSIHRLPFIDRDSYVVGHISYENQSISILAGLPKQMEHTVLLHELIHGIFHALGEHGGADDERLVQGLSSALYVCMQDNPELFNVDLFNKEEDRNEMGNSVPETVERDS